MKLWAHRGCSQRYPENTLPAFEKAAAVQNLTGIELDIQLTKDKEMLVIHDERVDRKTEGIGYVRDYTFSEIRKLHIYADKSESQKIPTITEVLDLLDPTLRNFVFFLLCEVFGEDAEADAIYGTWHFRLKGV